MSEPTQKTEGSGQQPEGSEEKNEQELYDSAEQKRFEYKVVQDGLKYEIAHVFGEITDERYLKWLREFKVTGNEDDVSEESREASARLWDDVIVRIDGIEYEPEIEWKGFIPASEKIEALNNFLAVAISDDEVTATTKLQIGTFEKTLTVRTEAWGTNGQLLKQTHVLRERSFELEKKYSRIQGKRFKQENVKGLRRKAKVEYVPQDEKLAELYDEMQISAGGFAGAVPLRFKTTVIHHVFDSTLEARNLGK